MDKDFVRIHSGTYWSYIFFSLENASKFVIGSEPGDSRNINGIAGALSLNDANKSNGGGSTKVRSMFLIINDCRI